MARIGNRSELEAFVRSVELASLSAAARELSLTPSTLSKLVTRLERALKVRLVTRSSRRILPTPEGERFLARCRRILAEIEDAETEVTGSRERPRGRLRISAGPGFGMGPFARALPRFLERYPDVQLDLVLEDQVTDVVRYNLDIALTVWRPQNQALVVKEIFDFGRITCAAPSYLKKHGKPASIDEIARHRWLRVVSMLANPIRSRPLRACAPSRCSRPLS
ncbi:MAG TPA: LysR family transcriptional regulator [Usitatibacter sp.]|nr:LysR family transcriptional regulator [Usitatibacter sp.]